MQDHLLRALLAGKAAKDQQEKQNFDDGGMVLTNGQAPTPYNPAASNPQGLYGQIAGVTQGPYSQATGLQAPTITGGQQFQTSGYAGGPYAAGAAQGAAQQGALSGMLMGEAQGTGPSPAKNLLAQATGQNVAQTGALMASQRGANANPALLARQAAMAGSQLQQQAAGQAATLTAEQQLAAQAQLGGLSNQQIQQQLATNQQNIQQQQGINAANAALSGQAQGARAGLTGGALQGAGAASAIGSQGIGGQQASNPTSLGAPGWGGSSSGVGPTISGTSAGTTDLAQQQLASDGSGFAMGGKIGPRSFIGMHLSRMAKGGMTPTGTGMPGTGIGGQLAYAKGGRVPAMVSPGEIYLPPGKAQEVAKGKASPQEGHHIPGKAKVKGDSLKNDTVNMTLEEGGVVVPRSKSDDYDKAAAFVRAVMAKQTPKRRR